MDITTPTPSPTTTTATATAGRPVGAGWTLVKDRAAYEAALSLARGTYQRSLIEGIEALSGSTLRGRARLYAARYAASRDRLLARLERAGVPVREARGAHGRRILVIG